MDSEFEKFEQIVNDNYDLAHPAYQVDDYEFYPEEDTVERKASALDGVVVLVLFGLSVWFITWACLDFGWDQVRLMAGLLCASVCLQYSQRVNGRK